MYAIFKGNKYQAVREIDNVYTIISDVQEDGFEQYINIVGQVAPNTYVREVTDVDLDYLYDLSYQVKYKGRYYHVTSNLNQRTISKDMYVIQLSFPNEEEKALVEALNFERPDKFQYTKRLYRKEIDELVVIETPLGIFADQGKKETVLVGEAIDAYLAEVVAGRVP